MEQQISCIPCALFINHETIRIVHLNLQKHLEFVENIFEKMGQSKHLKKGGNFSSFSKHIDIGI